MVYLIVGTVLLLLTVKGYSGKKVSIYINNFADACYTNLIRVIICAVIGLVIVMLSSQGHVLFPEWGMLLICLFSGASNVAFLIGWVLAIRKNSMVAVDVSLTVGSIIPAILCFLLFFEAISLSKLIGFAFIILASCILAGYSRQTNGKPGVAGVLYLLVAVLGDGFF